MHFGVQLCAHLMCAIGAFTAAFSLAIFSRACGLSAVFACWLMTERCQFQSDRRAPLPPGTVQCVSCFGRFEVRFDLGWLPLSTSSDLLF